MNRAEIDAHNAKELGLSSEQMEKWNRLMNQPISQWPTDLQELVRRRTDKTGLCGDVWLLPLLIGLKRKSDELLGTR